MAGKVTTRARSWYLGTRFSTLLKVTADGGKGLLQVGSANAVTPLVIYSTCSGKS